VTRRRARSRPDQRAQCCSGCASGAGFGQGQICCGRGNSAPVSNPWKRYALRPPSQSLQNRIESLASRLAGATSKIAVKRSENGTTSLWEEETTTHRSGFTSPKQLADGCLSTKRLGLGRGNHTHGHPVALATAAVMAATLGIVLLATAIAPPAAGALILVGGLGLLAIAAMNYWRAGAPKRKLQRAQRSIRLTQAELQKLLEEINVPRPL
jgi:hypothetical protein